MNIHDSATLIDLDTGEVVANNLFIEGVDDDDIDLSGVLLTT